MKKPVTQRKMFMAAGGMSETNSEGIISGFNDEELEDEYENRTPDNIEIIANNLRGDIRSMDERYLELAQMVGESAFETPEEVIALMQAQFAQPQAPQQPPPAAGSGQGIAGIMQPPPAEPQGIMQGVAEPGMEQPMPQPGMEQPMPQPGMEQPVQMAQGGIVYRQMGSPPTGEVAPGRRQLGFMRFMEPGSIPDPRTMDPRSTALPRVQLQQTPAMARSFVGPLLQNAPVGSIGPEGAKFLQSGAARPGTLPPLPQQIPLATRFSTNIAEAMRSAPGFTREAGRTLMATPIGKGAAALGAGVGLLGVDQMYRNIVSPQGPASSGPPAVSEVPGVDAQGRYTAVPLAPQGGGGGDGAPPPVMRGKTGIPGVDTGGEEPAAPAAPIPTGLVPIPSEVRADEEEKIVAPPRPREKTYDERVQDRLGVFNRYLGSDPEMRKAQALFLLAEAALNVAGAKGRSTAERLTVGLKGFPAGMAALGAEADRERRSIAASAISAVESDIQATAKYNQQVAIQAAKNAPARAKLERAANYYMNRDGITQDMLQSNPEIGERYFGMAQLIDDKMLVPDKTGDLVDPLGRPVPGFSKAAPTPANGIGYLDPANPLVKVSETFVTPATTEEKSGLITTKANNEQLIVQITSAMDHLKKSVGLGPSIRAGVTNITAPIIGDVGLGLTDIQTQALRSKDRLLQDVLVKAKLRNPKAPVWEQKNIKDIIGNPSSIVNSWEEYTSVVNNILQELLNENAMIDARLNPGQPLKQIDRMPVGSKTDPLIYSPNLDVALEDVFKNRPNAKVWVAGKDESGREIKPFQVEGARFKEQLNSQRGQRQ